MGSMAYCRFRNIVHDMCVCADHLDERIDDKEEDKARDIFIKICKEVALDHTDPDDFDR